MSLNPLFVNEKCLTSYKFDGNYFQKFFTAQKNSQSEEKNFKKTLRYPDVPKQFSRFSFHFISFSEVNVHKNIVFRGGCGWMRKTSEK